jgi:Na+-driven multidrug efflux pump
MNARAYCLLLRLYPAELRHAFGAEMTQVFLDDIDDNGAARVWWRSFKELFRIALPAAFSRRYVQVPTMMYLLMVTYFGAILMWGLRDPGSPLPHPAAEFIPLLTIPGLVSAAIALVALYIGDRAVPEPLNLR